MPTQAEIEKGIVQTFVTPSKQDRFLAFIDSPKNRSKFVRELYHFRDLDNACLVAIPSSQQHAANIVELLKSRGAPKDCYVISTFSEIDGKTLPLSQVLPQIVGYGHGTILSCIPGRLGYFEGESPKDRSILVHA